jgi:hypothetical protein
MTLLVMETFLKITARVLSIHMIALLGLLVQALPAFAHGFTADVVDIKRLMNGKYRVYISYTHLQIGEYREAHIDFKDKKEAIEAFRKLVAGAEFFLGDAKGIHFHGQPESKDPF